MDIKTMSAVLAIGYLVFGLMLFLFQANADSSRRIPFWAVSKIFQALGLFLMAGRDFIPDLFSVALGNIFLLCGYAYEAWALVWVSGRTLSRRFHLSVAAVICLISLSFLFLPIGPRLVIASSLLMVIFGAASWALFNFRGRKTRLSVYQGVSLACAAGVMAARAAWALFDAPSATLFSASLVQQIGALCFYYLLLTSGFGILLLAKQTSDLELRAVLDEQGAIWATLPTGLCILHEWVVERCNPAMEAMFGFVPGTLPGHSLLSFSESPADFEAYGRTISAQLRNNQVFEGEIPFRRQNGELFWARVQGSAIFLERSQVWAVFSFTDITERKQAGDALHASEGKLRTMIETSPDGIATSNLEGTLQFATAKLAALLGYASPTELLGRRTSEFIHPDDQEKINYLLNEMFNGHLTGAAECLLIRQDGSQLYGEANANLLLDAEQQPVGILYIVRDITERKQVEAALRESEAKFRAMTELLPQIVFEADASGRLMYVNQQAYRILGYPPDYPIQNLDTIELYLPADRPRVIENIRRRFEGGQGTGSNEYTLIRMDGSLLPVLVYSNLILKNNQPAGLRGIMVDVTEQKQAEAQIRQLNTELEARVEARTQELREAQEKLVRQEKLAVLGQLAGSVGHELRNPLGVINSAIYYLRLVQPDAAPKVLEYLSLIEAETRTANKIITDLLDFSRAKAVDLEPITGIQLVRETLKRFPVPEPIQVTLDFPADLPKVYVDPQQLIQVLGNLVLNACQAMPQGGQLTLSGEQRVETPEAFTVETEAGVAPRWLLISVKDTGGGIAPENLEKIFEPLFTTKSKGIGLGLAVSKKLVEANGGKITVQNEPGQGAVFTVFLPLSEAAYA